VQPTDQGRRQVAPQFAARRTEHRPVDGLFDPFRAAGIPASTASVGCTYGYCCGPLRGTETQRLVNPNSTFSLTKTKPRSQQPSTHQSKNTKTPDSHLRAIVLKKLSHLGQLHPGGCPIWDNFIPDVVPFGTFREEFRQAHRTKSGSALSQTRLTVRCVFSKWRGKTPRLAALQSFWQSCRVVVSESSCRLAAGQPRQNMDNDTYEKN